METVLNQPASNSGMQSESVWTAALDSARTLLSARGLRGADLDDGAADAVTDALSGTFTKDVTYKAAVYRACTKVFRQWQATQKFSALLHNAHRVGHLPADKDRKIFQNKFALGV